MRPNPGWLVVASLSLLLLGQAPAEQSIETFIHAEVIEVLDGDTIRANVLLPWGVTLRHQTIRAADYDAWESSKRRASVEVTDAEVERGKVAAAELRGLLTNASVYVSPADRERDVYGRLLGTFTVISEGKRVRIGEWMRERGHTRGD